MYILIVLYEYELLCTVPLALIDPGVYEQPGHALRDPIHRILQLRFWNLDVMHVKKNGIQPSQLAFELRHLKQNKGKKKVSLSVNLPNASSSASVLRGQYQMNSHFPLLLLSFPLQIWNIPPSFVHPTRLPCPFFLTPMLVLL